MPEPIQSLRARSYGEPEPLTSDSLAGEPGPNVCQAPDPQTSSDGLRSNAPPPALAPEAEADPDAAELASRSGASHLVARYASQPAGIPAHLRASPDALDAVAAGIVVEGGSVTFGVVTAHRESGVSLSVAGVSVQAAPTDLGPVTASAQLTIGSVDLKLSDRAADGSRGAAFKLDASWISAEATASQSGWSLTVGSSLGVGVEASSGMRDADEDGYDEWCVRAGSGPVLLGFCVEPGPTVNALGNALNQAATKRISGGY